MVNLFQSDRPDEDIWAWYAERQARCTLQIMELVRSSLDHGIDAIVELGLIKTAGRLELYSELESEGRDYRAHVLEAPREERKRRVAKRNTERGDTFAMHVSDEVFELASDMWEPISEDERTGRSDRFETVAA